MSLPLIKKVHSDIYFRLEELDNPILSESLQSMMKSSFKFDKIHATIREILKELDFPANFCRISQKGTDISLMEYDSFEKPHPELLFSVRITLGERIEIGKIRSYGENPPILHRVELYFPKDSELFRFHSQITEQEESLGVFDRQFSSIIGRKFGMIKVTSDLETI
jgi:hypothetical protein